MGGGGGVLAWGLQTAQGCGHSTSMELCFLMLLPRLSSAPLKFLCTHLLAVRSRCHGPRSPDIVVGEHLKNLRVPAFFSISQLSVCLLHVSMNLRRNAEAVSLYELLELLRCKLRLPIYPAGQLYKHVPEKRKDLTRPHLLDDPENSSPL